ncbi:abhydrolase domain-containing protein 11 [Plakobranchus ocellatus]|uniref:sn-1-specific diacylglycerol lipase ABHD11 n=1 Tax=Plakobranchus ocellatus TaxID=259542 RepID=A0AAV4A199_9GAST|nr:abhydrolase domain-containing protein 11 [Plakobranchus ocellatus]
MCGELQAYFSIFFIIYIREHVSSKCTTVLQYHVMTQPADPHNFLEGEGDIELSYTTYPDHDHAVDPRKTPLIFAHGLFGGKGNLHSVSKHLSNEGRKVITYDARNHGDSQHSSDFNFSCMADDLSDLIDDLRLIQPFVMGHSMGGKTAMMFALTKPEKLKALIVGDVTPSKSPGGEALLSYAQAMKAVEISKDANLSLARRQAKLQLAPTVPDKNLLNFLLTNLKQAEDGQVRWRNNLDAFINNFDDIMDFLPPEGATFTKPTLFVFGEKSQHYSPQGVEKVKTLFPQAEIVSIKDAGHFVHAEKPLEFVKVVQDFCDGLDASG